jgi:hypothetical protein
VVHYVTLTTWKAENGRTEVQGQPRQVFLKTPISTIITAKWTGGVAQVVERQLCKCEAMNSNTLVP